MYTLGINAVFHDSAACLVHDGVVVAAVEEERFTRVKHAKRPVPFSTWELPYHAIDYCLAEAGIRLTDVDHVAYSFDPFILLGRYSEEERIELPLEPSAHEMPSEWESSWDPLFLSHIVNAPRHLAGGAPHHLQQRLSGVRHDGPFRWHWVNHHIAHAASAFLPSPFEDAAILTLDGRGERATTSYSIGHGTSITEIGQVDMPNSLGMLYEQVTAYLGFLHSSDEYKVMALASYGEPRFAIEFRNAIEITAEGQYRIGPLDFVQLFGPCRNRGDALLPRHYDVARSLQMVLQEVALQIARWLRQRTGESRLCMAGGVALNCVLNAHLRDSDLFDDIWVQPAAGDAGTALGAALWVDARERESTERTYQMKHAYLGPAFSEQSIEELLKTTKTPYRRLRDVSGEVADLLIADLIVGWFQGRLEFGPRALGSRSILASPINEDMQGRLNEIKDREDFRPVAPVVLEDEASAWFRNATVSPFMLFVHDVLPHRAAAIPAVRHVDGTARIQTISRDQNPLYYDLIRAFQARTGVPILVNTSFNIRGDPIVATPRDALAAFWTSPLDALVIGPFLIQKDSLEWQERRLQRAAAVAG